MSWLCNQIDQVIFLIIINPYPQLVAWYYHIAPGSAEMSPEFCAVLADTLTLCHVLLAACYCHIK